MAPCKPRFSVRAYAGKRKPKPSLISEVKEDAFDLLLPNRIATSNIFDSSNDQNSSSSQSISGTVKSILEESDSQQNSRTSWSWSVHLRDSLFKVNKGSVSMKKKKRKILKSCNQKYLKSTFQRAEDHMVSVNEVFTSTPKVRPTGAAGRSTFPPILSSQARHSFDRPLEIETTFDLRYKMKTLETSNLSPISQENLLYICEDNPCCIGSKDDSDEIESWRSEGANSANNVSHEIDDEVNSTVDDVSSMKVESIYNDLNSKGVIDLEGAHLASDRSLTESDLTRSTKEELCEGNPNPTYKGAYDAIDETHCASYSSLTDSDIKPDRSLTESDLNRSTKEELCEGDPTYKGAYDAIDETHCASYSSLTDSDRKPDRSLTESDLNRSTKEELCEGDPTYKGAYDAIDETHCASYSSLTDSDRKLSRNQVCLKLDSNCDKISDSEKKTPVQNQKIRRIPDSVISHYSSEFHSDEYISCSNTSSETTSVEECMALMSISSPISALTPNHGITFRRGQNRSRYHQLESYSPADPPIQDSSQHSPTHSESSEGSEKTQTPELSKRGSPTASPKSYRKYVRGSDVDKRQSYRMSKSLPARLKDSSLFSGCSDIDLARNRKASTRYREDPSYYSSTQSLPSVLEDQNKESVNDEELQTPRTNYPFRKCNSDPTYGGNSFILGFSNSEFTKFRRAYSKKKHLEDLACSSSYTLPALQEDESDSSGEEDESKRLESGSSSQVESPVLSPGIQGSPSRRGSARISTSNSSETSLSSRSEGMASPLQDEMGILSSPRVGSPEPAAGSSEEDSGSSPVRRGEQARRRRSSRLTSRLTLGYIAEESESDTSETTHLPNTNRERLVLMTGKKYRRSLAIIHTLMGEETVSFEQKGRRYLQSVETVKQLQREDTLHVDSDDSSDMSTDSRRSQANRSMLKLSRRFSTAVYSLNSIPVDVPTMCSRFSCLPCNESVFHHPSEITIEPEENRNSAAETIILRLSKQDRIFDFKEVFADGSIDSWKKIGEGVYSEVFSLTRSDSQHAVLKIIPIDGEVIVNGGIQKSLEENLSEVLITYYLSDLRDKEDHFCEGFVQLLNVWYMEGAYPEELVELWNKFDENYGSDNDRPVIFPTDQRFLGLELVNSGKALESYSFSSARQSISIFKQVAFSLAVGELAYDFEHRDLHWGNVLVDKTKHKALDYRIDGETYSVPTNGVRATIIDYTWSSLTAIGDNGNMRIVNDMEQDPDLFIGSGDLQFDIYRQMREDVEQDWSRYQPKTNLRWLFYLADKLINRAKYQRPTANAHKTGIASLHKIIKFIPLCESSLQVAVEVLKYK